ncbi:MAG TPA: PHP domain-containing protein [Bacillota bacterium]
MWKAVADYHTHTRYSGAGGSIRENAQAAQQVGLEVLGIADHGPANWGHFNLTKPETFEQMIVETRRVEQEFSGLRILAGTEANIISFDGELDIPIRLQRKLDQVLAGFHLTVFPKSPAAGLKFAVWRLLADLSPQLLQRARNDNTKAVVEAVFRNEIDIITHPGLHININTPELARACARTDTALEINSKHGRESIEFIKAAAGEGVKFAIGSDAHRPEQVGRLLPGIKAAQAAGLKAEQIINVVED